jgi:hypothetical protein
LPITIPPEAVLEDSWDDVVSGPVASKSDPDEIFDRDTAIPASPAHREAALELDLSSIPVVAPPPSDPFAAAARPPDGPRPSARREEARRTTPARPDPTRTQPRAPDPDLFDPPLSAPQPSPALMPTKIPEARPPENERRAAYALTSPAPAPTLRHDSDRELERAPTEPPENDRRGQQGRKPSGGERKRTVPEPMVERYLAKHPMESTPPAKGPFPARPSRDGLELEFDLNSGSSPLDLVDSYQHSAATLTGDEFEAAHRPPANNEERGNLSDMQDRYAVGDFTGALVVAESLLDLDPENEDAKRYAQSCREVLTQMYAARIGPMDQVASVAVPPDQITWLSLDHRAGFLLSLIDGVLAIEEILDISGMSRLDALRIMYTLVQQNVITLRQ